MYTEQQIQQLVNNIALAYKPEKIILFGSYAKNTATDVSDIDLCVIKNDSRKYIEKLKEIRSSIKDFKWPIDLVLYSVSDFEQFRKEKISFTNHIYESGKIVYGH